MPNRLSKTLARNWWLVGLRGVAGILFGLLTLFNPAITLAVLVLFFGAYALADGVFTTIAAIARRRNVPRWGWLLVSGVLGILIGVLTFLMPGLTALVLLYIIASWAIIRGIAEIVAAIQLRKVITGEWLLVLAGVLSAVFGVLLFLFPGAGALTVVLWIGAFATVFGILMIALAFRLRRWNRELGHRTSTPA
ncbi:MAG: HdeD family acid-resistance protein [Gemmatimonadota bacterium]